MDTSRPATTAAGRLPPARRAVKADALILGRLDPRGRGAQGGEIAVGSRPRVHQTGESFGGRARRRARVMGPPLRGPRPTDRPRQAIKECNRGANRRAIKNVTLGGPVRAVDAGPSDGLRRSTSKPLAGERGRRRLTRMTQDEPIRPRLYLGYLQIIRKPFPFPGGCSGGWTPTILQASFGVA